MPPFAPGTPPTPAIIAVSNVRKPAVEGTVSLTKPEPVLATPVTGTLMQERSANSHLHPNCNDKIKK